MDAILIVISFSSLSTFRFYILWLIRNYEFKKYEKDVSPPTVASIQRILNNCEF